MHAVAITAVCGRRPNPGTVNAMPTNEGTLAMAEDDLSGLTASTLDDLAIMVKALHEIATEAVEGEVVRAAIIALQSTQAGREYLREHPLTM